MGINRAFLTALACVFPDCLPHTACADSDSPPCLMRAETIAAALETTRLEMIPSVRSRNRKDGTSMFMGQRG